MEKTRRGVYYDLDKSPYEYEGYKFSSAKKLDIFMRKVGEKWCELTKYYGKIYKITDNGNDYDLTPLLPKILKSVYDSMQYH